MNATYLQFHLAQTLDITVHFWVMDEAMAIFTVRRQLPRQPILDTLDDCGFATTILAENQR